MKRLIIPVIAILLIFTFVAYVIISFKKLPYEKFESLQELKNSLSSDLDIRFPNTTGYEFIEDARYEKDYLGKSSVVMGYTFGGFLDLTDSHTDLWQLNFGCTKLDTLNNERNPVPPLNSNTKVLETDTYEHIQNESEDSNIRTLGWYPDGSKIVNYYYRFDLEGCRYHISGTLVIPPEKLNDMDTQGIDREFKDGKDEVLSLVKSIISQQPENTR